MSDLTHFDESGGSRMVHVGGKPVTERVARASGVVSMRSETAAKRTGELIPLCHPLGLDAVSIQFDFPSDASVAVEATVSVSGRTGVEMEALTAVSVAALTIYDMCKSVDRGIVIERIQLEEKTGGKSGHYVREKEQP